MCTDGTVLGPMQHAGGQLAGTRVLQRLHDTRFYTTALGFGSGFQRIYNGRCIIEHDNDRSDVALVKRADIDGAIGLTITLPSFCSCRSRRRSPGIARGTTTRHEADCALGENPAAKPRCRLERLMGRNWFCGRLSVSNRS